MVSLQERKSLWWKLISRERNCPIWVTLVEIEFFSKHTASLAHCQQTDLTQKSNGIYLELTDKDEKDMPA